MNAYAYAESKVTQEQPPSIKICMHLVCVILNSTMKWAGPCSRSYRSMETPPEPAVFFENIVNHSTSQCQGPMVLWSVLEEREEIPLLSMNCVMGVNPPCPFLLKQGQLHSGFLCFHFVQMLQKLRFALGSAALGRKQDGGRLAL